MESNIMKQISFSFTRYVTPVDFCKRYYLQDEKDELYFFAIYLCNIIVFYPSSMNKYGPNKLGAAALYLARKVLKDGKAWSSYLQELSGYSEVQLKEAAKKICSKYIDLVFNNEQTKKQRLQILEVKYSEDKYCQASLIKPEI